MARAECKRCGNEIADTPGPGADADGWRHVDYPSGCPVTVTVDEFEARLSAATDDELSDMMSETMSWGEVAAYGEEVERRGLTEAFYGPQEDEAAPSEGTAYTFAVTVTTGTAAQAAQVMGERIDHEEDYGFPYKIERSILPMTVDGEPYE
jgi:hypothetical protein